MDKVWWVETEDGECKHFKTEEGARQWALEWAKMYGEQCGISVEQVEDYGLYHIYSEPMGN